MKKEIILDYDKWQNSTGFKHNVALAKKYNTLLLNGEHKYIPNLMYYDYYDSIRNNFSKNIDTVIINPTTQKVITLRDTMKSIYFKGGQNLGGLTIDYDILIKNAENISKEIVIEIDSSTKNLTDKINVAYKDKAIEIPFKEKICHVRISPTTNNIKLEINKNEKYNIDKYGNITHIYKTLNLLTYENDVLNLKEITSYDNIEKDNSHIYSFKELYIDKSIITQNLNEKYIKLGNAHYDKLTIYNDSEMRLNPETKEININSYAILMSNKDKLSIIDTTHDKNSIINIDKELNIEKIDEEYIKSNFKDVNYLSIKYNDYNFDSGYFILIEQKNNKYTVLTDDNKTYHFNNLFFQYIRLFHNLYYGDMLSGYDLYDLSIWDLFHIYCRSGTFEITAAKLDNMYNDYLKFFKKLDEKGISRKVLYHTLFKEEMVKNEGVIEKNTSTKFDSIEYMIKNPDLTKEEVEKINEFGKVLIKRK